jgi:hypothetical protein
MPYRQAYASAFYREQRRIRIRHAGYRCEAILATGERCPATPVETHHVDQLSTARSLEEAIAMCDWRNLRAVCWPHNPRGGR